MSCEVRLQQCCSGCSYHCYRKRYTHTASNAARTTGAHTIHSTTRLTQHKRGSHTTPPKTRPQAATVSTSHHHTQSLCQHLGACHCGPSCGGPGGCRSHLRQTGYRVQGAPCPEGKTPRQTQTAGRPCSQELKPCMQRAATGVGLVWLEGEPTTSRITTLHAYRPLHPHDWSSNCSKAAATDRGTQNNNQSETNVCRHSPCM